MNILIALPWDSAEGGVISVAGNLAKDLSDNGHTVVFFHLEESNKFRARTTQWGFPGFGGALRSPIDRRHSVRSVVAFFCFLPFTIFQLLRLIKNNHIDIINVHYADDAFAYFAICRLLSPIKLVTSIHGADFFPDGTPKRNHSLSVKYLLSRSDRIVAPSKGFLIDFLSLFPKLRSKSLFIHNSIELAELHQELGDDNHLDIPGSILSVATLEEKKGLDTLIHAFGLLANEYPDNKLVLVGDGPLRADLEQNVKELDLEERVLFMGERSRHDTMQLLRSCDVFVLASRAEPFGIVILEAMSFEKPIVATSVGGIPEMIVPFENGLLVKPDDAEGLAQSIRMLLSDVELRDSLSANGLPTVKANFLRAHMGEKYARLFRQLLSEG